jgi:hypothetical protein
LPLVNSEKLIVEHLYMSKFDISQNDATTLTTSSILLRQCHSS